ncbi:hypothetical protein ABZ797_11125 [Streptomyces antimycoticus]|uniref:hypothetical protein n=1 Tax=Streptomyces antimycoticus TaxID=68175 RepID=UPI00340786C5
MSQPATIPDALDAPRTPDGPDNAPTRRLPTFRHGPIQSRQAQWLRSGAMGRGRGGEGHIRTDAVRGTVPSVLCRAVLLLAAAIWVAPSCVHPAADHNGLSTGCPRRPADTAAWAEPHEKPVTHPSPGHGPSDVSGSGTGSGSDDCVTGPRGVVQALVPTPVPPLLLAEVPPPGGHRNPDSVRAPPDRPVRALGLHQLQVLRT